MRMRSMPVFVAALLFAGACLAAEVRVMISGGFAEAYLR